MPIGTMLGIDKDENFFVDNQLEKTIIGEMLINADAMRLALDELRINDFSVHQYRRVFEVCVVLDSKGKAIDPLVIVGEYPTDEKAEIRTLLVACASDIVTTVAYAEHIAMLKKVSARRMAYQKLLTIGDAIEGDADGENIQNLVDDLAVSVDFAEKKTEVNSADGFSRFVECIGKPKQYYRTGISAIDNRVRIGKGHYFVIGARPSQGKTALSLQMAVSMAERHKVLYFSFETSADRLYERILARQANVDYGKIVEGDLSDTDIDKIKKLQPYFEANNLLTIEAAGMTVEQIKATAIKHRADIVFIDYLGLVGTSAVVGSSYERTTLISMALHNMAQKTGIAVIALCQLSRVANKTEPDMTALRDSGQIEQDADEVMFIHTPDDDNRKEKKLIVAKNKDGECGAFDIQFIGQYQRFQKPFEAHEEYTDIPFMD
jgi:replicative DNA helicase